ncbi:MAG: hypothetical protein M3T56_14930 [Chloroflexota bacterium]|nr:hypothetical protein [Chloroflexota bacterium]
MAESGVTKKLLDPEGLTLMRADMTALHASVKLTNPLPSGSPRFAADKLTSLYSQMSGYGFDSFSLLPVGAQMATLPARQAVISLDRTVLTEQFTLSGSSLRPFGELAGMLLDKVQSVLDVEGYRAVALKLVAFWPVGTGDAMSFLSNAVSIGENVTLRLGNGFDVAGLRFHRGKKGEAEEWNVKVEPLLAEPDKLWIEIDTQYLRPVQSGAEVSSKLESVERFLRNEVQDAVLAMARDRK